MRSMTGAFCARKPCGRAKETRPLLRPARRPLSSAWAPPLHSPCTPRPSYWPICWPGTSYPIHLVLPGSRGSGSGRRAGRDQPCRYFGLSGHGLGDGHWRNGGFPDDRRDRDREQPGPVHGQMAAARTAAHRRRKDHSLAHQVSGKGIERNPWTL